MTNETNKQIDALVAKANEAESTITKLLEAIKELRKDKEKLEERLSRTDRWPPYMSRRKGGQ